MPIVQRVLFNTRAGLLIAAVAALAACTPAAVDPTQPESSAGPRSAAPTPDCVSPADVSPAQTEGPYFKAGSPERADLLEPGMAGTPLLITGYVLSTGCQPIPNALLDFWQADANGEYDNAGYRLRGHQFSDLSGRYALTTVLPGLYPGRTRHIHVKVQAPGGPVLTTQLYFPDEAQNAQDRIFESGLLVNMEQTDQGLAATFDFVVETQ